MTLNALFMPGPSGTPIEYSATDLRQLIDAIFTQGVLSGGAVTQRAAGANLSVDVSAVRGIVDGTDLPAQGKYFPSLAALNIPTPLPVPVAGQSRIDSIVLQVLDGDQNGNPAVYEAIVTVIEGTPAATGSQVAPTLPPTCLLLANYLVGPSATTIINANITDERVQASSALSSPPVGGILGSTYTCTSTPTTFLTTTSLSVGTWDVQFQGVANCAVISVDGWVDVAIEEGTATAIFLGPTVGEGFASTNSAAETIVLRTLVEVTVAGTIVFNAWGSSSTSIDIQTGGGGDTGATGWTATRVY